MGMLTVRIDRETEARLRSAAAREGISVSAFMRAALLRRLDADAPPSTLERLGHHIGAVDAGPTPADQRDELTAILEERHTRQAADSRARRATRNAD